MSIVSSWTLSVAGLCLMFEPLRSKEGISCDISRLNTVYVPSPHLKILCRKFIFSLRAN